MEDKKRAEEQAPKGGATEKPKLFNPKKYKCWLTGYGMGEPNRYKKVKQT